ncbi:hypothetical protein [Devosia crocina]|nr:hypothetical protein [Devosia crocina]
MTKATYPGSACTPIELVNLAVEFETAAMEVLKNYKHGRTISAAPFRLLCIHAIELYLNAFLRQCGEPSSDIRSLQHNLSARLALTDKHGLVLKAKTKQHLESMSTNREYLTSRYAPDAQMLSQLNRLQATLLEVRGKVTSRLKRAGQILDA